MADAGAFAADDLVNALFLTTAIEQHGDRVTPRRWQCDGHDAAEEGVGQGEEDARAVAGIGIAPGRAAVHEVLQNGDALFNDIVIRAVGQVCDQTDAARVVFMTKTVQP